MKRLRAYRAGMDRLPREGVDYFSEHGARRLAAEINAYWTVRGQHAHASAFHNRELPEFANVDPERIPDYYVVRSAMFNGRPG